MERVLNNNRKHDIAFFINGRIDLSARVVNLLNIQCGDAIDIVFHQGNPYLYVRHRGNNGRFLATCKPTKQNSKNFRTFCKDITSRFVKSNDTCVKHPVGEMEYLSVGTALPIINKLYL